MVVEERYASSFGRPSYEVNERVQQETEGTRGFLRRNLGDRYALALFGSRQRTTTDSQDYLGTNLGDTLTEDTYQAGGELRMALSVKTQLVGGGGQEWYRFPRLPERDGDSTLAYGGFRTDETALIAGQALAGYRWFRLDTGGQRSGFYANVDAAWSLSPKTKLGARYARDFGYSAFGTTGATPTNLNEMVEVYLDKLLASNVYFRLFGRLGTLNSDGAITVVTIDGIQTAVRDDRVREAGVELGYQFRTRVRVGVTAFYTTRRVDHRDVRGRGTAGGLHRPVQPAAALVPVGVRARPAGPTRASRTRRRPRRFSPACALVPRGCSSISAAGPALGWTAVGVEFDADVVRQSAGRTGCVVFSGLEELRRSAVVPSTSCTWAMSWST